MTPPRGPCALRLSPAARFATLSDWVARHERAVFWSLIVGSALYLLRIKLGQHHSYNTGAFDLSMYDSAVSNTLKGDFLYAEQLGRSFFSEHFTPLLVLLVPVYWLADTPVTLLVGAVAYGQCSR